MNPEPESHELKSDARQPTAAEQHRHRSYLLRLWCSSAGGVWQASLQSVQSGERHAFADLDSLLAFLVEVVQTAEVDP